MPKITIDGLYKYFVDKKENVATAALYNVSVAIPDRKFTVILGASGCGKSTLLKTLVGIYPADNGKILFDNEDVTTQTSAERNVAYLSQEYALYPHLTVFDNVAYPLKLGKVPPKEIRERVNTVLKELGLDLLSSRRPRQLSGGQRQRVALARALVKRPCAIFLDEPLSNVDEVTRTELIKVLITTQKRDGIPFVYVTHNLSETTALAEYIIVMNNGEIAQCGDAKEMLLSTEGYFYDNFLKNVKRGITSEDL